MLRAVASGVCVCIDVGLAFNQDMSGLQAANHKQILYFSTPFTTSHWLTRDIQFCQFF